jgi:hypothetical protein
VSQLPESLDVVLNELRVRLYHASKSQDVAESERLGLMVYDLDAELSLAPREAKADAPAS